MTDQPTPNALEGMITARDLKRYDTLVDLVTFQHDDGDIERQQPRTVAQDIPAGTELTIGDDGRIYGVGLERPKPTVATFAGIPIQTDDQVEPGVVELRNDDGRVLARYRLESLIADVPAQEYAEDLLLRHGAIPVTHPDDAHPDAPKRFEAEAEVIEVGGGLDDEDLARIVRHLFGGSTPLTPADRPRRVRSIYVASSWRNPHQPHVVEEIRQATAAEVYDFRNPPGGTGFAWSSIDPDWTSWTAEQYLEALEHPLAEAGYASDFGAMEAADTFVLVLPCGRSAHLELGWAVGKGKRTVILTRDGEEPELMAKMVDHIATSVDDVIEWLVDQDAQAHHEEVALEERSRRILEEVDAVPSIESFLADPTFLPERFLGSSWSTPSSDPLADVLAAQSLIDDQIKVSRPFDPIADAPIVDLVTGLHALEEVAVAAAVDVDVDAVELLRDAASVLRATEDGPEVIRAAIATGLEHAARTLEAGNPVADLDEVLEIASELAATVTEGQS